MTTEWELECAVFGRFDLVLPDLFQQGYSIDRQVIISGTSRRMDLVLRRPDHAWILELKRGSPDVVSTTAQLLDYERCWKAAFPSISVSLMAISNSASDAKIEAFAASHITYRAVPVSQILDVLSEGISTELLGECTRLAIDDESRIRFLLSNFAHTTVPAGMRFGVPWTHESVFYALIRDGMRFKDPWRKNIYVKLFDHTINCAVLYHPEWDNKDKDRAPVHINTASKSWPSNGWLLKELKQSGTLEFAQRDHKAGRKPSASNFDHYRVASWDRFAEILKIGPSSNDD